jgi:peptidoglycan/LPS O-acetylase OafA/YrhL
LAILLVVFFHNFGFIKYFGFGWLGVDLFFVLSGYLISSILLASRNKPNFLKNFFIRRILRIFPLYYLSLIAVLWLIPMIPAFENNFNYYQKNQIWFWVFLQNWLFAFKVPANNILLHFWSLAVEEQFYLIWPFVIFFVRKPTKLLIIISFFFLLLIITRILIWANHSEKLDYWSIYTFTRVDGIIVGCALAITTHIDLHWLKNYTAHIVFSLSFINLIFFFLNQNRWDSFPFFAFVGYTTFAIIFALLIYEAIIQRTKVINIIFGNSILRFFGKISYSFYIFHWPIYVLLQPYFFSLFKKKLDFYMNVCSILSSVVVSLIGIFISIVSYYFFEIKFLKLKSRFS